VLDNKFDLCFDVIKDLGISFDSYGHPVVPIVEEHVRRILMPYTKLILCFEG